MTTIRTIVFAALVGLAPAASQAQDVRGLAEVYADLPEVQSMWDDLFSPLSLANQFRLGVPMSVDISRDKLDRIGALLSRQMEALRPNMRALMIDTMATSFTADELAALIAFYRSEHGAAVMTKMPLFTTRYSAALAPMIQSAQREVAGAIAAIMAE